MLQIYPQWFTSTTEAERNELEQKNIKPSLRENNSGSEPQETWPPSDWVQAWQARHSDEIYNTAWSDLQGKEVYYQASIPAPVHPATGDLLIFSNKQFHRILSERRIRALFYIGFEATECVQFSHYGIANMQSRGYLCTIIRDGTTTHEAAETLDGLWRTKNALIDIERRWGYSTTSLALIKAIQSAS